MKAEKAIGVTIRMIRQKNGWRAAEVARQVPISRAYLSEIEHGHKAPSLGMLNDIAKALEMEPYEFWYAVGDTMDTVETNA